MVKVNRRGFLTTTATGIGVAHHLQAAPFATPGQLGSQKPLVVDCHSHLAAGGKYADPAALVEVADEVGIDILCCSPVTTYHYDMQLGNAMAIEAARRFPDRIVGFVNIPSADHGPEILDAIEKNVVRYGLKGLGEIKTPASIHNWALPATSSNWIRVFKKAAELKIPILAHQRPTDTEVIAEKVPEAIVIMAHMGNGDEEGNWRRAILAAQRYPNIYLETASSTTDLGFIEAAVEAVGPERIVFGSDLPLLDPHVQLAKITGARISSQAKRLILGENMSRLLGLERRQ